MGSACSTPVNMLVGWQQSKCGVEAKKVAQDVPQAEATDPNSKGPEDSRGHNRRRNHRCKANLSTNLTSTSVVAVTEYKHISKSAKVPSAKQMQQEATAGTSVQDSEIAIAGRVLSAFSNQNSGGTQRKATRAVSGETLGTLGLHFRTLIFLVLPMIDVCSQHARDHHTTIAGSPEASFWVSVDFYLLDEVFPRDDSGSGGCFSQMSQKTKDTDFSAKSVSETLDLPRRRSAVQLQQH